MNIVQIQNDLKDFSDQQLMGTMQSGSAPQYLVLAEMQRRKGMRDKQQQPEQPQGSVAEDLMSGIAQLPQPLSIQEEGIASYARGGRVSEMGGRDKAAAVERGFKDASYKNPYTGKDEDPPEKPDLRYARDAKPKGAAFSIGGVIDGVKNKLLQREGARGDTTGAAETGKMGLSVAEYNRIKRDYGNDVTEEEAIDIFMDEMYSRLSELPGFDSASPRLQEALLDSSYNLGPSIAGFPRLTAALAQLPETGDEEAVAKELLDTASIDGKTSKGVAARRAEVYNEVVSDPAKQITEVEQTPDGELVYWAGENQLFRYGQDKDRHESSAPGIMSVGAVQVAQAPTTDQQRRQRDLEKYDAQDMPMPPGGVEYPEPVGQPDSEGPTGYDALPPERRPQGIAALDALRQYGVNGEAGGAQSGANREALIARGPRFTEENIQVAGFDQGGVVIGPDGKTEDDRRWEEQLRLLEAQKATPAEKPFRMPTKDDVKGGITDLIDKGKEWMGDITVDPAAAPKEFTINIDTPPKPDAMSGADKPVTPPLPEGQAHAVVDYALVDAQADQAEKELVQMRDPQAEVDPNVDPYLAELQKLRADATPTGREKLSEFLMAAGFGMMASNDPSTLRNMGVGGMQGLEALSALKKDGRVRGQQALQEEGAYRRGQVAAQASGGYDRSTNDAVQRTQAAITGYETAVKNFIDSLPITDQLDNAKVQEALRKAQMDPNSTVGSAFAQVQIARQRMKDLGIDTPTETQGVSLPQGYTIRPKAE